MHGQKMPRRVRIGLQFLSQPKHVRVSGVQTNNQFRPEILQTIKEAEFCVPSVLGP